MSFLGRVWSGIRRFVEGSAPGPVSPLPDFTQTKVREDNFFKHMVSVLSDRSHTKKPYVLPQVAVFQEFTEVPQEEPELQIPANQWLRAKP